MTNQIWDYKSILAVCEYVASSRQTMHVMDFEVLRALGFCVSLKEYRSSPLKNFISSEAAAKYICAYYNIPFSDEDSDPYDHETVDYHPPKVNKKKQEEKGYQPDNALDWSIEEKEELWRKTKAFIGG